jgi:hypothetical protein
VPFAPKRRWSYSLRTLFVVVCALAMIFGALAGFRQFQMARERAALREGIRHGWMRPESGRLLLGADEITVLTKERDHFLAEVENQLGPPTSGIGSAPVPQKTPNSK